jgi:hypothetical protein
MLGLKNIAGSLSKSYWELLLERKGHLKLLTLQLSRLLPCSLFAVHPSHFQLAYLGLDRSIIISNLYLVLWKVLVPKGQGFP